MPGGQAHIFARAHSQLDERSIHDTNIGKLSQQWIRARNRKRKAGEAITEDEGGDDDDENEDDQPTAAAASDGRLSRETTAFVSLTAHEHAQRRAAGLPPSEPLPAAPFPHHERPAGEKTVNIFKQVRKELLDVQPPLPHLDPDTYSTRPFRTNKDRTTLKEQHVSVLTTLLHTMLGRGDYVRAGRAWALLLRSGDMTRDMHVKQGIAGMDLRTQERWGIGAELLMRRQPRSGKLASGADEQDEGEDTKGGFLYYTPQGFALARRYYDRLIVQYPSGRGSQRRKGAQATTFYTAMFSAWIYEVNLKYKDHPMPSSPSSKQEYAPSNSEYSGDEEPLEDSPQLTDVEAIVSRMDDIIESPPYDKNGELLVMRGMLGLWVLDLSPRTRERDRAMEMMKIAGWFRKAEKYGEELNEVARDIVKEWEEEVEGDEVVVEDEDGDEVMRDDDSEG